MVEPQNALIVALPRAERLRLLAIAEPVELIAAQVLCEREAPTRNVYFPGGSIVSLVTQIDHHPSLEIAMIGGEGMVGIQVARGVMLNPFRVVVSTTGAAWRVAAPAFRREWGASPPLQRCLGRYQHVLMLQLAGLAACQRFHQIGPRLARWLLMCHDRAGTDHFRVTHEYLACMLGVRRVGVTVAAGVLAHQGLVRYHRGELIVLDRVGLEAAACSCHRSDRQIYQDWMR